MTVMNVHQDPDRLTLTISAEFDAPVERVWQLWADPRQLERWWGPPGYPATFTDHDLVAGGRAAYFMTSPEGERYHGWWRVLAVDAPHRLVLEDGFADAEGRPNDDLPVSTSSVDLDPSDAGGTGMRIETTYPTIEAMEQVLAMGAVEGMTAAMGQIDGLLAEIATT